MDQRRPGRLQTISRRLIMTEPDSDEPDIPVDPLEASEARCAELETELRFSTKMVFAKDAQYRELEDRCTALQVELNTMKTFIAAEDERELEEAASAAEVEADGGEKAVGAERSVSPLSVENDNGADDSIIDFDAPPQRVSTAPSFNSIDAGGAGGATFGRSSTVGRSSTAVGGSRTERSRLLLQVVHLEEALRIEGRRTSNVRETLERTKQAVFGLRKQLAKASDHIDGVK